jgi:hypothetical protein
MVVICVRLSNFLTCEFWDKSDGRDEEPPFNGLIRCMVVICVRLSNFLTYESWDKSDGREQPRFKIGSSDGSDLSSFK